MTTTITFEEALCSLGSGGTESAVAAFQLGWEGERLEQWTPASPGLDRDWAADTILRIESVLRALPTLRVAATDDLFGPASYPGTAPLRQVLRAVTPDTRGTPLSDAAGQLAGQLRHALLVSRADGPLPGPGATAPLGGAQELGLRLARVCLQAKRDEPGRPGRTPSTRR